jgi:hypothetical protein
VDAVGRGSGFIGCSLPAAAGGDTVVLMTTVPEPSTALLLALGLVGIAAGRRYSATARLRAWEASHTEQKRLSGAF